jgi:cyclopropane-fatty-acyl-phospholipid synthase
MDGTLPIEDGGDIYDLLDLLGRNMTALERTPSCSWSYAGSAAARASSSTIRIGRAQQNVAHHYDLKDQLYDFFLDRDRQYSCAYFKTATSRWNRRSSTRSGTSRQDAAAARPERARHRLGLGRHGLFLGQQYGVDVTGVTLSKEQHAVSSRRALEGGLADRCASSCSTIARKPAVRPHRLGRHVRACRRRPLRRVLHQGEGRC